MLSAGVRESSKNISLEEMKSFVNIIVTTGTPSFQQGDGS